MGSVRLKYACLRYVPRGGVEFQKWERENIWLDWGRDALVVSHSVPPFSTAMMKTRLPFRLFSCRAYSTRLPEKPRMRQPDPLLGNPKATTTSLPDDLTFIHRPPPSAPTPLSYTTNPTSPLLRPAAPSSADTSLPPLLRKSAEPKPRMSDEDLAEMRRLRALNPAYYTRSRLAERFNCTATFVGYMAKLSTGAHRTASQKLDLQHEKARSKWGEKKLIVREIRKKRKAFW
ncbi:hypothetical protein EW146_g9499 [Bondarzewia mesenterica]|uniref:Uncharacterized protein n=1 Tax=Bondarzewia mesenterica TaxID=1095465 RepID=A0A4V3XCQ7_9AGAM|nr:hypothetical protein EW146_g9499 [Bondarzewia mesenterica]